MSVIVVVGADSGGGDNYECDYDDDDDNDDENDDVKTLIIIFKNALTSRVNKCNN